MSRIKPEHFNKQNEFGEQGLIAPMFERNLGISIRVDQVVDHLIQCRKCINDNSSFKQRFSEADCKSLVEHIFGDVQSIHVQDALSNLRPKAATPEIKLLMRALAIRSYDQLSPDQTKRVNPHQLYNDLYVTERDLLPEARSSGAGKFIVYRLIFDEIGQTRIHVYPPDNDGNISQDARVHEHMGDSSSIILAGKIVNQHHKIHTTKTITPNALYEVITQVAADGKIQRSFRRKAYVKNIETTSSHVYEAGDYYNLPGSLAPAFAKNTPVRQTSAMQQTIHTVGNIELSATLFTQRRMPFNANDTTVLADKGEEYTVPNSRYQQPNDDKCYALLVVADQKIRHELVEKNIVNCSPLSNFYAEAITANTPNIK